MNSVEINRILRTRCRGQFVGVFAIDRLPQTLPPRRPLLLVCNTDPHDKPGKHWIAIYVGSDSKGEYFDSFCQPPPARIKNYLNKFCTTFSTGIRQLQSASSRFCRQWVIFYCLFRSLNYSMIDINSCFSNDTGMNDVFVYAIVCKLI